MLFGDKTIAWFDIWSIEHFASGFTLGFVASMIYKAYNKKGNNNTSKSKLPEYALLCLCIAYLWEVIEHYLEAGVLGDGVTYWFHGVEFWGNRVITDPILVLAGCIIGYRYPRITPYASVFSTIWVTINVFIFSHCMVAQDYIASLLFE